MEFYILDPSKHSTTLSFLSCYGSDSNTPESTLNTRIRYHVLRVLLQNSKTTGILAPPNRIQGPGDEVGHILKVFALCETGYVYPFFLNLCSPFMKNSWALLHFAESNVRISWIFCDASTEGQAPFTCCLLQVESMKIDFLALLAVEYSSEQEQTWGDEVLCASIF